MTTSSKLKTQDLYQMQDWGRVYAKTLSDSALNDAAYYMVVAAPEERFSLRFWWEEGIRNNSPHQKHIDECNWELRGRIEYIRIVNDLETKE